MQSKSINFLLLLFVWLVCSPGARAQHEASRFQIGVNLLSLTDRNETFDNTVLLRYRLKQRHYLRWQVGGYIWRNDMEYQRRNNTTTAGTDLERYFIQTLGYQYNLCRADEPVALLLGAEALYARTYRDILYIAQQSPEPDLHYTDGFLTHTYGGTAVIGGQVKLTEHLRLGVESKIILTYSTRSGLGFNRNINLETGELGEPYGFRDRDILRWQIQLQAVAGFFLVVAF